MIFSISAAACRGSAVSRGSCAWLPRSRDLPPVAARYPRGCHARPFDIAGERRPGRVALAVAAPFAGISRHGDAAFSGRGLNLPHSGMPLSTSNPRLDVRDRCLT